MAVDTVIFDIGGVLVNSSHRRAIQRAFGVQLGENERDAWDRAKIGAMSLDDYYDAAVKGSELEGRKEEVAQAVQNEFECAKPCGAYEVLHALHKRGCRLGILTDHLRQWVNPIIRNLNLEEYCAAILVSQEEGMCKPNHDLYLRMCTRLSRPPSCCVLVDDVLENVEGFRQIGGHGIQYNNPAQLDEELRSLGLGSDYAAT